jgi:multiple sugar transport system substrate-binding protein
MRTMTERSFSRRDFLAGVLATGTVAAVGTYFAPGGRSITVNFVTGADPTGARTVLVDMWNRAYPRAFVRVTELSDSTGDARAAMISQVESGDADVLNLDVIDIPFFQKQGHIEPVELPNDTEFLDGTLVASTLEDPGENSYWAAPFNADVGVLFERLDADVAIDTPAPTLATVVDQLPRVTPGRFAGQLNPQSRRTGEAFAVNVLEHALSRDDRILRRHDGVPAREPDVWQRALQPLRDAVGAGRITVCDSENDTRDQFRQKGLTYMRNWPVKYRELQTDDDPDAVRGRVRVSPLPVGVLGGQSLALVNRSFVSDPFGTSRAAAADFIRFLTGEPAQKVLAAYGFPATRIGAYTDDKLEAFIPHLQKIRGAVESARPRPVHPDYATFSADTLVPTMKRVLQGEDLWTPTSGGTALGTAFTDEVQKTFY